MILNRSIRPIFRAVFVFAVAAVTLCLRVIISGADRFILADPIHPQTLPLVFNQTLLTFASDDLGDVSLRQNVEHLVDGGFHRSFRSIGRYRLDTGARSVNGGPVELNFNKIQSTFRRNLQNWWKNRKFDPDVLSKSNIVKILKKSTPTITGNSNSGNKFKTCAVVGNSGILLKTNLGNTIDTHEFVIRLNNARINGYEQFVGSKTSLSFMNSNILHLCSRRGGCFCHPYGSQVPILIYMSQPIHFLDYTLCNSSHKAPLMITDPQLDVLCARIVKYYSVKRFVGQTGKGLESWGGAHGGPEFHYSSGMQAVMLALGICEQVGIFGFGKSDSAKHHYHTNQKKELSLHDYEAEYDMYEDLVKNPKAVPFVSDKFEFPRVVIHR